LCEKPLGRTADTTEERSPAKPWKSTTPSTSESTAAATSARHETTTRAPSAIRPLTEPFAVRRAPADRRNRLLHGRGLTKDSERALPDACPIVASYGARDRWPRVRGVLDRLEPVLTAAGIDHDIKRYPDTGHGSLNDHDPAELPIWVKAMVKLVAAGYHEPSSRDARRRIVAFFRTHLG
jgi:alpha-beta hydrolase superfamily lysophospholipase